MKLSEWQDQYETLPHGPERVNAIRSAIAQADAEGNHRWKLYYRDELVGELVFYGDPVKGLPVCAEYADLFEKQPMDRYKNNYLWVMSSALLCWDYLPQLTLDERKKMMEHYLKGVHRYRGSLREYHSLEFWQCLYKGKPELARIHHKRYMQDKPRANGKEVADSICLACWYHNCGENYLALGDWDMGLKWLQPIIDGRIRCKQEPIRVYNSLVAYALEMGRREDADHFAALLAPRVDWYKEGMPLEHSLMIRYLALNNPRQGLRRLEQVLPKAFRWWSKDVQQGFYYSSWVLCAALARRPDWLTVDMTTPLVSARSDDSASASVPARPDDPASTAVSASPAISTVSLELPREFPLYRADGQYPLDELAQWFRNEMLAIAQAFDTRNGYPWNQQSVDRARYAMARMLQEEWAKPPVKPQAKSTRRSNRQAGQPKPPRNTQNAPYQPKNKGSWNKQPKQQEE